MQIVLDMNRELFEDDHLEQTSRYLMEQEDRVVQARRDALVGKLVSVNLQGQVYGVHDCQ